MICPCGYGFPDHLGKYGCPNCNGDSMNDITKYLAAIGSKGGKTTGKSKLRGSSEHYKRLSKLAAKARKKK